jgi:hypothetical protein
VKKDGASKEVNSHVMIIARHNDGAKIAEEHVDKGMV